MKVVVGKVVGEHQTPVFTHEMKYLIFRPFWNVPISIIKKELAATLRRAAWAIWPRITSRRWMVRAST